MSEQDNIRKLEEIYRKAGIVCDPVEAYNLPEKGPYTIEDYYAIPDERRVELIDGVIYDMAAPDYIHQLIIAEVLTQIKSCIRNRKTSCRVFPSPCDVQLQADGENDTIVQPDLIIICNREMLTRQLCKGAPEFVMEVLSRTTRRRDLWLKRQKYKTSGVREYWIVDPDSRQVFVYDFDHSDVPAMYPFSAQIPILLSEGKCRIDFAKISEAIDELNL
ncbi:MAG: Uma2 family endonuclease [Eubacterium sp.]|nr:Uma2 family endonuclease [Eubacterium sp.]